MKGIACVAMAVLLGVGFFSVSAFSQEEMVVVDNRVFDAPQRPSSRFEHDAHNEAAEIEDCAVCHHVYDDDGVLVEDESSEDSSCSECHGIADEGRIPNLRKAYHRNCKGCHREQGAGPVLCGECHPW
ncbi:MAG: cytochrome c3 family protein [Desulfosarcinaceae bacterium]|nr:cytochrome c3 family protein [Desulfosarcinaceae bacterium]